MASRFRSAGHIPLSCTVAARQRRTLPFRRAEERVLGFVHASNGDIEFCLRHGNRLALRLDCEAVLLEIAGGEIAADAGQHLAHRADVKLKQ
jgi:hypothetical protein